MEDARALYLDDGFMHEGRRVPASDRDPEREELLRQVATTLSREDLLETDLTVLSNDQIAKLIEERANEK